MHTIDAIRNEARIVWSVTDDGLKAAIRTAYQTAAPIGALVTTDATAGDGLQHTIEGDRYVTQRPLKTSPARQG